MRKILPRAPDEGMEIIINLEMELPQKEISAARIFAHSVYSILGSSQLAKIANCAY